MGIRIIVSAVALFLLTGCGKDTNILPDQRNYFESYLSGLSLTEDDYEVTEGVYRYLPYRAPFETDRLAAGDSLYYRFTTRTFSRQPGNVVFTNVTHVRDSLKLLGLNTLYWPNSEQKTVLGGEEMTEGLKRGLRGCRQGDSVVLLVTSDLGYGTKHMGVIEPNTPLFYTVKIDSVLKK